MEVTDTLSFVLGVWRAERSLTDERTGTRGTFTGSARFVPRPAGESCHGESCHGEPCHGEPCHGALRYQERGHLLFGGHAGPAARSLLWVGRADGAVDVSFADGRPFHVLDLRPGAWRAEHRCGGDRYQICYRVLATDVFEERWQVRGPRKCYQAVTTLTRTGQRG